MDARLCPCLSQHTNAPRDSASTEMLAFDGSGRVLNYDADRRPQRVEDICSQASKVVHLIDSPGLEKVRGECGGLCHHRLWPCGCGRNTTTQTRTLVLRCAYMHTRAHEHTHTHVHSHTCTHTHTHTYTYTHTRVRASSVCSMRRRRCRAWPATHQITSASS